MMFLNIVLGVEQRIGYRRVEGELGDYLGGCGVGLGGFGRWRKGFREGIQQKIILEVELIERVGGFDIKDRFLF